MRSWLTTNLAARMISHVLYGNTVSLVHCTDARRPSPFDRFMSADLSIRVPSSAPPASLETPVRWTLRRAEFHAAPFDRPESLHPALWRADQLGRASEKVVPSGFDALDAQLPGGGWPRRALTELLLPHPGIGEIRLLAPLSGVAAGRRSAGDAVRSARACRPRRWRGWASTSSSLLVVYTRRPSVRASTGLRGADSHVPAGSDSLWALEQALKSGHVGAVVAWLPPRLRAERLRRLQLAAHNARRRRLRAARDGRRGAADRVAACACRCRPAAPTGCRCGSSSGAARRSKRRCSSSLPAVLSEAARRALSERRRAPVRSLHAATFVDFA